MSEPSRKRRRTNNEKNGPTEAAAAPPVENKEAAKGGARYHCNYCARDISGEVRIKCAKCTDFDLCVDCFYVGVETSGHLNSHPYRVMDDLSIPLYTSDWGADEELLLLEGIDMFGLGNWMDVAEHVGTKNKLQCEHHYWSTYIDVPTAPIPEPTKEPKKDKLITEEDIKRDDKGYLISVIGKENAYWFAELDEEEKKKKRNVVTYIPEVGYLPLRGDYEIEFQNDVEEYIAEMEIKDDEKPEDRETKLKMLKLYHFKLEERERRKQFIKERDLINKFKAKDKKKPKDEEEILATKFRPFARFVTTEQFDTFIKLMARQKLLRQEIEELKVLRQLGITSLDGKKEYEDAKRKRESDLEARRSRERLYISRTTGRSRRGTTDDNIMSPTATTSSIGSAASAANALGKELLSVQEADLCTQARLSPRTYILIKDVLIRENAKHGVLSKMSAYKLLEKIDAAKVSKVYDFLLISGWIAAEKHH